VNEYPIIFSEKMVRAILAGKKSQTRRIVEYDHRKKIPSIDNLLCPYGHRGDFLWVCEVWQALNTNGQWWHEIPHDDCPLLNWAFTNQVEPACEMTPPHWLPPAQMPRMASRILLEITGLRIERLNQISENDAIAEGCQALMENGRVVETAVDEYARFWDGINLENGYPWQSNPFVWVISFRRVQDISPVVSLTQKTFI
jgi:hypothetical protein